MEYYGNNDWRDYLAHYGVKGMKWGEHKISLKDQAIQKIDELRERESIRGNSGFYINKKKKKKSKKSTTITQLDNNLEKDSSKVAAKASDNRSPKDVLKIAKEIIRGNYGSGSKRRKKLTKKYGDWKVYQNKVNELLGSKKRHR